MRDKTWQTVIGKELSKYDEKTTPILYPDSRFYRKEKVNVQLCNNDRESIPGCSINKNDSLDEK